MKWLTNTYDPSKPGADLFIMVPFGYTQQQVLDEHKAFLSDKIIGRPKATSIYTTEQLEEMGMVGVYVV